MSPETQYLSHSMVWSVVWLVTGVLCTLSFQAFLKAVHNHWRHQ